MQSLNTAVVEFFDSAAKFLSTLPANDFTSWLGGALLLTRRTLFNQTPTVNPVQISVSELTGRIEGTIGATDAEGDPLRYSLTQAPQFGTVQIAPDGTYTYTPTTDSKADTFTVAVSDRGFNLLDPFSTRSISAPVPVRTGTTGFNVYNLSGTSVKFIGFSEEKAGWIQGRPDVGTVLAPGQHFHTEIYAPTFTTYDTSFYFAKCADASATCDQTQPGRPDDQGTWTVVFTAGTGNGSNEVWCERSDCSYDRAASGTYSISRSAFLIEKPGTTIDVYPDTPFGAAILAGMLDRYNERGSDIFKTSYGNAVFTNRLPSPTDFSRVANLDNPSDSKGSAINHNVETSFSATQSRTQTCSVPGCTYDLSQLTNPGNYMTLIMGLISGQIAKNYSVTESETQTKKFSTTVTLANPPWSVNRIMAASPELDAKGDLTVSYDTYVDPRSYHNGSLPPWTDFQEPTWPVQKFVFHNLDFVYPDPNKATTEPIYTVRTEPLQPKDPVTGKPVANTGFRVADKKSPYTGRTDIAVGQQSQLTVTAFNGFGSDTADYTLRATYTSADPTVATVDSLGVLSGHKAGTTTVEARYDWTIPNGTGVVSDYVIANMVVNVSPSGEVSAV